MTRFAGEMGNILEQVTIPAIPLVGEIKRKMLERGAFASMMTGSGPTVFGLFDSLPNAKNACQAFSDELKGSRCILTGFIR